MIRWLVAAAWLATTSGAFAQVKAIPKVEAVPEPYDQVSFRHLGKELARFHYGKELRRPFVYPINGPSGKTLTRMGHPQDPVGHSHHNSFWISHHDVAGVGFWNDQTKGRIVTHRIEKLIDGDESAAVVSFHAWVDEATGKVVVQERRRLAAQPLEKGEWLLVADSQFEAKSEVTIGKTPFGFTGVRMAKSIGVHDGGGTIANSEGAINEKGVFWKPARWVDYSGSIGPAVEGIALFDHKKNPNHPAVFHVRDDGWMGASFTFAEPYVLKPGASLRLRYALYVHAGGANRETIDRQWQRFADTPLDDLTPAPKKK